MIIKFNLKSNASNDKCGCGGDGNNPGGDPTGTSLVIEERRLNYALRRLLGFAERIMAMDDEDENKWTGMKGLMEMMERKFPQLINADSCLELDFEEVFYGQKPIFWDLSASASSPRRSSRLRRWRRYTNTSSTTTN